MRVWKVVCVLVGLLVMLAALAWLAWTPPRIPTLTLIGYTNKPYTLVAARVLFRNESRVPLEILPRTRDENVMQVNGDFFLVPGFHSPWPGGLGRVVQPGDTTVFDIHLNTDLREPWWTEVCTYPKVEPSRLRTWAARVKHPTLRRWAQRLFPPVKESCTKLGPFTNLPPGWVRGRDQSAWRGQE